MLILPLLEMMTTMKLSLYIVMNVHLPTMDPELPPSTDMATPTPLGIAMASPTTRQLQPVLLAISTVGHWCAAVVVMANMLLVLFNFITKMLPKMKPQMMQIRRQ